MSVEDRSLRYAAALDGWEICEQIGSGSNGRTAVYRIEQKNAGWTEVNALKAISITDEYGVLSELSEKDRAAYLDELAQRKTTAEAELQAMYALRGLPTIASFLEHRFVDWQEEERFGCDLLIRMELMECLRGRDGQLTAGPGQTEQIGRDICEALVECHKRNIIHRDIKPANIFKNRHGRYQLGDFGISRTVSDSRFASTGVCTEAYAAPEQLTGRSTGQGTETSYLFSKEKIGYTELVDIYSLGLTLYELCNDGRLPFAESRYANQSSVERRLSEKQLPPPCNADAALSAIILKACAYAPKDRYQSAQEMLDALEAPDPYATRPAKRGTVKRRPRFGAIAAAFALLLCLGTAAWYGLPHLSRLGEGLENTPSAYSANTAVTDSEPADDGSKPKADAPQVSTKQEIQEFNDSEPQKADVQSKADEAAPMPQEQGKEAAGEQKNNASEPKTGQTQDNQTKEESDPVAVASVTLSKSSLSINNGGTATLSASVLPNNAEDRSVTWQSSDISVVKVSGGKLSAVGDGTAVITASAGGKKAKCTVTVQTIWSEWADALPDGVTTKTETKTVYRYTDYRKETEDSYSPMMPSGYQWGGSTTEESYESEEVVDVEGHYEYRYGCWVGANGGHSYCNVMAEKYYGAPARTQYTDWSTEQYVNTGTMWTCGSGDTGKHKHDGTGGWIASDTGNHVWYLYSSSGSTKTESGYYWEEKKWVDATYKTEYKPVKKTLFHYYRMVMEYESSWSAEKPAEQENRTIEQKTQYRYMITD